MEIVENYVPSKEIKPTKDVPWLNHCIKQKMKNPKRLYIQAKVTQTRSDWTAYRQARNEVNIV